jgi:hypothetical protein
MRAVNQGACLDVQLRYNLTMICMSMYLCNCLSTQDNYTSRTLAKQLYISCVLAVTPLSVTALYTRYKQNKQYISHQFWLLTYTHTQVHTCTHTNIQRQRDKHTQHTCINTVYLYTHIHAHIFTYIPT